MKRFKEIVTSFTTGYSEKELKQAANYIQEFHKYCKQHEELQQDEESKEPERSKESLEKGHFTLETGHDMPPLNLLHSAFDDSSELDISITGSVSTNTE